MTVKSSQEQLLEQVTKKDNEKSAAIKNIENQITQLATKQSSRPLGQIPYQPTQAMHQNAIFMQSGFEQNGPMVLVKDDHETVWEGRERLYAVDIMIE